jgi:regulator of protease activity HflC (stomatin/prohibitin superfamily)
MTNQTTSAHNIEVEEKNLRGGNGMLMLLILLIVEVAGIIGFIQFIVKLDTAYEDYTTYYQGGGMTDDLLIPLIIVCAVVSFLIVPTLLCGLKVVRPNEARVLTLFGKYYGTLRTAGFHYVNPFVISMRVPVSDAQSEAATHTAGKHAKSGSDVASLSAMTGNNRLSLKTMTLNNQKQKINDKLGNPIIIGIVVVWRVQNTAKAMFSVDNFQEFLSTQCDSALRTIVRLYPYDTTDDTEFNEKSLRTSSDEISENLRTLIQTKVSVAGLEILEARITHLAYAPEIAAAMLQRQQASAVVDARQMIVEGAVSMVEMALKRMSEQNIIELDEERKAAMVSNLMVVLVGNKDAQPIVNSGSLY